MTLYTRAREVVYNDAMTNPLTRDVKGYPLWGWLALLVMIAGIVFWLGGKPAPRCTPEGDCQERLP